MTQEMNVVNIASYKFVTLAKDNLPVLRIELREKAMQCNLKGTILLSTEGINLILAGLREDIEDYKNYLDCCDPFKNLSYKESMSSYRPFTRMLVRIKKEIISMGRCEIQPEHQTAPTISPEEFKRWYEEKRDMIVLDTRNDYEVALGSFDDAIDLNLETFRNFPDAIELLPASLKEKSIVTFCTGGVRCEKGAELMRRKGFKNVYQLEGGILNYFEKCGGAYYHGECFVFDHRVAVDTTLNETDTTQCYACRSPLTVEEQTSKICPHCQHIRDTRKSQRSVTRSQ